MTKAPKPVRWPKECPRCGYDQIKRGPGTFFQCKRCQLDGGQRHTVH